MNGTGSEVLENFQTLLANAEFFGPVLAGTRTAVTNSGTPDDVTKIGKLLGMFQKFLDDRAPDLTVIAEAPMPPIDGIAAATINLDTGKILTKVLDTTPDDGTITLHVSMPDAPVFSCSGCLSVGSRRRIGTLPRSGWDVRSPSEMRCR